MICNNCGGEFETKKINQRYCSSQCQKEYNIRKRHPKKICDCPVCGKQFETGSKKYCSKECRYTAKTSKKAILKKVCKGCGKQFETRSKKKIFCNTECCCKYYQIKYNPDPVEPIEKTCIKCDKEFTTTDNRKIFCSTQCWRDYWHRDRVISELTCITCNNIFTWNSTRYARNKPRKRCDSCSKKAHSETILKASKKYAICKTIEYDIKALRMINSYNKTHEDLWKIDTNNIRTSVRRLYMDGFIDWATDGFSYRYGLTMAGILLLEGEKE